MEDAARMTLSLFTFDPGVLKDRLMQQHTAILQLNPQGPGFTRLSNSINAEIRSSGIQQGLCVAMALHTSCSLTINENADPRVLADLEAYLRDLVPRDRPYRHDDEGPDDMPAHIRAALTCTSLSLPIAAGRLLLGTWQEVYLWEHRDNPAHRSISLTMLGS